LAEDESLAEILARTLRRLPSSGMSPVSLFLCLPLAGFAAAGADYGWDQPLDFADRYLGISRHKLKFR